MSSSIQDAQSFYAAQGLMTDPREQADLLAGLPLDLPGLCRVVQGLLIHPDEAFRYGGELSKVQRKDAHIRPAVEMLALIRRLDSHPLQEARPAGERIAGTSRDHAVLLCSFLRQQGRPARVRPGFVTYLGNDLKHERWICEAWDASASRWQKVDTQIDEVQRKAYQITVDACDLPDESFYSSARAWLLCRKSKARSGTFGRNRKERGWNFLRTSLVQELAALNKVEVLPLDRWWELAARQDDQMKAPPPASPN